MPHWTIFKGIKHIAQGAVGDLPVSWAHEHSIRGTKKLNDSVSNLRFKLDRNYVRKICSHGGADVLLGYVCAMAWGGQGSGPLCKSHPKDAWKERGKIEKHLELLRAGKLTRSGAYDLFSVVDHVDGLGPAFFTKLLYFFSPNEDFYIMDRWTARSVNLLTGREVVRITNDGYVADSNTGENYENFCTVVDDMARQLKCTGAKLEERLFSCGGGDWRKYVENNT